MFQVLSEIQSEGLSYNRKETTGFSVGLKGIEREVTELGVISQRLGAVMTVVFDCRH